MKVDCNIDSIIEYLQEKKKAGYETVELIDDARAKGWFPLEPKIEFIFSDSNPKTVGIDVRTK